MLTTASIWPLAPLYFEIDGLKTSSNSKLTAWNVLRVSSSKHPSGSRITLAEYGLTVEGGGRATLGVQGDSVVDSGLLTGVTCLAWHSCSPLFRMMGQSVVLVIRTAWSTEITCCGRGQASPGFSEEFEGQSSLGSRARKVSGADSGGVLNWMNSPGRTTVRSGLRSRKD